MGMEDNQSWTNREIIRETEERMAYNQKRAIQLLKLMNGDDDTDEDDRSSEHDSAIAEGEGEDEGDSHKEEQQGEGTMNDDILMINMDNGHSDMKYDEKGDVISSSNNRPTTITATADQDKVQDQPNVVLDQEAIEAAVEKLSSEVSALNMSTTASAELISSAVEMPHDVEEKVEKRHKTENSDRNTSSVDEEGVITPPLMNTFKMNDEDSDEEGQSNRTRVSPLERLRSGRFSRTATRRSSHLSTKSSPSSRPSTRPGTADGVDESAARLRNMMLFSMGSEKFNLQLPQDTPDAQDNYSEQYTTGKVVNDYLFQDSLPKEFWYIFEVSSTDKSKYMCTHANE